MRFTTIAILLIFNVGCSTTTNSPADIEKRQSRRFDYSSSTVQSAILNYHRSLGWDCADGYKIIHCYERSGRRSIYEYELQDLANGNSLVRMVMRKGGGFLETEITQTVFNGIEKQLIRDSVPFVPRTVR